jgi:hypothetical protein
MKRTLTTLSIVLLSSLSLYACGDDDDDTNPTAGSAGKAGNAGNAGNAGKAGAGAGGSASGASGSGGASGSSSGASGASGGGAGGASGGGAGGASGAAGSAGGSGAGGAVGGSGGAGGGSLSCDAALEQALSPINKVSTGEVIITSEENGVRRVFIDATAGGFTGAAMNPRVYVSLATASRVDLTDPAARTSSDWDISIKRAVSFANGGDGGPGGRAVAIVDKAFDQVVGADVATATFSTEDFLEEDCSTKETADGQLLSSTTSWYSDAQVGGATVLSPVANKTFLIRRPDNTVFKIEYLNYYASPDGSTGNGPTATTPSARYLIRVATLSL